MIKINIKGILSQKDNKGNLVLTLKLNKTDREFFLLEKGEQPKGMIKIIIKEVSQ